MDNYITLNGIKYVRADAAAKPGKRAVVVVDRGWIFAGDIDDESKPGRIRITRAVWVFRWESVGFAAVVEDPVKAKADIRRIADLDVPAGAELFRIPVHDSWGL
jgi:hypothetical protein